MIELYLETSEVIKLKDIQSIPNDKNFIAAHLHDCSQEDLNWLKVNFNFDLSVMEHTEDIEISSHFSENENSASFHFSIPYFSSENRLIEEPFFIFITHGKIFSVFSSKLDNFFDEKYPFRLQPKLNKNKVYDAAELFKIQIEFLADYYADITESLARRIKNIAARILLEKKFMHSDLDVITHLNFNNMLIKESINEFIRIMALYRKSDWNKNFEAMEKIEIELTDLNTVSDYIQFNFDRLYDLKENISNKIDLEQNRIIKILTMVTACIAPPTLIAGIYGMNFEVMPELKYGFAYPLVLLIMLASFVLPLIFFKKKKWM